MMQRGAGQCRQRVRGVRGRQRRGARAADRALALHRARRAARRRHTAAAAFLCAMSSVFMKNGIFSGDFLFDAGDEYKYK